NPMDDTIRVKQGMVLDLMDRSAEAFLYYQQAMLQQPHNRYFKHVLGFHYLRAGNLAKAKESFFEVIQIPNGRRERNKQILDQARQVLQMIDNYEKQQAQPVPAPAPTARPAAVVPPPANPAPRTPEIAPEPRKNPGNDTPLLGPVRTTP